MGVGVAGLKSSLGLGDGHVRESSSGHHEGEHPTGGRDGQGGGGDGEGTGEQDGARSGAPSVVGALAQLLDGEAGLGRGGAPLRGEGR